MTVLMCFMTMFPFVSWENSDDFWFTAAKVAAAFILFLILLNCFLMSVYILIHACWARDTSPHFEAVPEKIEDTALEKLK